MSFSKVFGFAWAFSAGLGSLALRQARMLAATVEAKQLRDLHLELKVEQPTPAPAPQ